MVTEGDDDDDDDEETLELPAMLLQPKSATSMPLDFAGVEEAGQYRYEVEGGKAPVGYEEEDEKASPAPNTFDDDSEDEDGNKKRIASGAYAATPALASKLVGLEAVTRGPGFNAQAASSSTPVSWVTQSVTFERKAPLNLVVKGVAKELTEKDRKAAKKRAKRSGHGVGASSAAQLANLGHWIVVSGFTPRPDGQPGPAEASGKVRVSDCVVGVNGEPLPEGTTFNEFARSVREAAWPLTLHTVRDSGSDAPDAEGWVARMGLCPSVPAGCPGLALNGGAGAAAAAGGGGEEGEDGGGAATNSSSEVTKTSPRRYLVLRGRWLYYHQPVSGGALLSLPQGAWDMESVELLQGVYDKYGPTGEQWGVALKLREPVPVSSGSQAMMGHVGVSFATEAEMQVWLERFAYWAAADRARQDAMGNRRKGGLRREHTKPLPVAASIWVTGLDSVDRLAGGTAARVAALRSRIDRMFFEEFESLAALASAPAPDEFLAPRLPGLPPGVSAGGGGSNGKRDSIISGGALYKQKGLRPKGSGGNYTAGDDDGYDNGPKVSDLAGGNNNNNKSAAGGSGGGGRAAALVASEDEEAAKLLASALYGTIRLGESPTLGDALYKYQQQVGGTLSAPDTRLLLSAVGVTAAASKMVKDETGLVDELNQAIRDSPDGGRLPVHQVAVWVLRYAKARAKLYLALSKQKRRKAVRSDMSRAERHLVASALPVDEVAEVLTQIQPDDQRDLLKRKTPAEAAAIVVELKGGDVTREGILSLLEPDVSSAVGKEISSALAAQLREKLAEGKPAMAITALKRMTAGDGSRALDSLAADEAAFLLDELPSEKEKASTLGRMDVHAKLAAVRALDRRHLRKVLGQGGGKSLEQRVGALNALPADQGAAALGALAREDHHSSTAAAASALASGRDAALAGAPSGPAAAAELLVGLSDWKVRTGLLKRLPAMTAADVLAPMAPVDAAACLSRLPKAETQALVLSCMEPAEAKAVLETMAPDQQGVVGPATSRLRANGDKLWRMEKSLQADALRQNSSASSGSGSSLNEAAGPFADGDHGKASFLARLPAADQADLLSSLSAAKSRLELLDSLGPLERADACSELGRRHASSLAKLPPQDRLEVVAKLPAGALAATLSALDRKAASDAFSRMGSEHRTRLMAKLCHEATPEGAAAVLRLLKPEVASVCLSTLPVASRAAMLHPLAREERDAIMGCIGASKAAAAASDNSDLEGMGFDPRVAFGEAKAREAGQNEKEATLAALTNLKQLAASWEQLSPKEVAEVLRAGSSLTPIEASACLTMMDARDCAAALDALDGLAGSAVQARVLSRLPVPCRNEMVARLGQLLMGRLARGAVSSASAKGSKTPSATAVARALAARSPTIAGSVVSALPDPSASLAVLKAMRPQARASCLAAMPAASKARCVAATLQQPPPPAEGSKGKAAAAAAAAVTAAATALVLSLTARDQAACLLLLGKDAQGAVLRGMDGDDQRAALAAISRFGSGGGSGGGAEGNDDLALAGSGSMSADTLLAMGPARQAVLLGGLPPAAAAALLGELPGAKAKAGTLQNVPEEAREAILASFTDSSQRKATRRALETLLAEGGGGGGASEADVRAAAEAAQVARAHEQGNRAAAKSRPSIGFGGMTSLFGGGGSKGKKGGTEAGAAAAAALPVGHQQKASTGGGPLEEDDEEEEEEV
jgi:Mg/Co/Ni transporter MgtE